MGKSPFDSFEVDELPSDLHHWRNAFDSRFLRFSALEGKPRVCTIANVQWLKSSNRNESKRQLLVTLAEYEKPWAINLTNSETIAQLYTDDPRAWVGKRVTLYPTKTKFGPQVVDCIRVRDQLPAEAVASMSTKTALRQSANLPPDQRQPAPAQAAGGVTPMHATGPKAERRPEVNAYLAAMKDATEPEHLHTIEEDLVNADNLTADETQFLAAALAKRQRQLKGEP
jgi:hypothetical protein